MSTHYKIFPRSPGNSNSNNFFNERNAEGRPPDKKMKIILDGEVALEEGSINIAQVENIQPHLQQQQHPQIIQLEVQSPQQEQEQQQQEQGAVATGGIQIIQQIIGPDGHLQKNPVQLTPQQLEVIRLQMSGATQEPVIIQTFPTDAVTQPQEQSTLQVDTQPQKQSSLKVDTQLQEQSTLQVDTQPYIHSISEDESQPQKETTSKTQSIQQQQVTSDIADKDFQCKHCKSSFKNIKELNFHVNKYHQVKCEDATPGDNIQITETGDEIFVCRYCEANFRQNYNLKIHVRKYHQVKHENALAGDNIHYTQITEGVEFFVCRYCKAKYKTIQSFNLHVKKFHQDKRDDATSGENKHYIEITECAELFVCQYCDRRSKHEIAIQKHIRRFHPGKMLSEEESRNECDICGKQYSTLMYLHRHKERVHGTKRYVCNICDNFFVTRAILKKHMKDFHPGFESRDDVWSIENISIDPELYNKNAECPICNRLFTRKYYVKRHMETAHPEAQIANFRKKGKTVPLLRCWLKGCNVSFHSLRKLRLHLMKEEDAGGHGWMIEEEKKVFSNIEEFTQWKEDVEENENLRYIKFHPGIQKEMDGSWKRTLYCSRSGRFKCQRKKKSKLQIQGTSSVFLHQPGVEKVPKRDKTRGSSKIGYICPSTMEIHCNSLGTVTCTYYKTHGHDTTDNIMYIHMHRRDKQFILEKVAQGVENKKILEEIHKKGGRSAFIILKDIKNCIMSAEKYGFPDLGQENEGNFVSTIETFGREEVVGHEDLSLYNYEMDDPDSFIPEEDDSYEALSEDQTVLSGLSRTLSERSGNSIDCIKAVTHQLRIIDNTVQIYQVNDVAK